jgi:hypothetical protein
MPFQLLTETDYTLSKNDINNQLNLFSY